MWFISSTYSVMCVNINRVQIKAEFVCVLQMMKKKVMSSMICRKVQRLSFVTHFVEIHENNLYISKKIKIKHKFSSTIKIAAFFY
jgi:hypothetical protein